MTLDSGKRGVLLIFISLFAAPAIALAQEDCPAIIQAALNAADQNCSATSRNQACYGNITLELELRSEISATDFDEEGERVDVANISTLQLLPWGDDGTWGIALMKLQTNLPDTLPGENVTFLLFGDVEIENGVETNTEPVTIEATAIDGVNIRSGPSANDQRVGGLAAGDTVTAIGRNEDGSWVQLESADGQSGWVSSQFLAPDGDIELLNVFAPANESIPALNPMQAFFFRSGINDAPCEQAPDSGILVQTPEGVGQIEFTVNQVNIRLGSTIYLQAHPGGNMTISVVEGGAWVEAAGTSIYVPVGAQVLVPIDNQRRASGPPFGLDAYGDVSNLPIDYLEIEITIAAPLTEEEIAQATFGPIPDAGTWRATNVIGYDCSDGRGEERLAEPATEQFDLAIDVQEDGESIVIFSGTLVRTAPGVYELDNSTSFTSITMLSDHQLIYRAGGTLPDGVRCWTDWAVSLS